MKRKSNKRVIDTSQTSLIDDDDDVTTSPRIVSPVRKVNHKGQHHHHHHHHRPQKLHEIGNRTNIVHQQGTSIHDLQHEVSQQAHSNDLDINNCGGDLSSSTGNDVTASSSPPQPPPPPQQQQQITSVETQRRANTSRENTDDDPLQILRNTQQYQPSNSLHQNDVTTTTTTTNNNNNNNNNDDVRLLHLNMPAIEATSAITLLSQHRPPSATPLLIIAIFLLITLSFITWSYGFPSVQVMTLVPPFPDSLLLKSSTSLSSSPLAGREDGASNERRDYVGDNRSSREYRLEHVDGKYIDRGKSSINSSSYHVIRIEQIHHRQDRGTRHRNRRSHQSDRHHYQDHHNNHTTTFRFEAFGKTIHIDLEKLGGFYLHNLPIIHVSENRTFYKVMSTLRSGSRSDFRSDLRSGVKTVWQHHGRLKSYLDEKEDSSDVINHCFHQGHVRGDPGSKVVVSLCSHMSGIIEMFNKRYVIEPLQPNKTDDESWIHIIYEMQEASFDDIEGLSSSSSSSTIRRHHQHHHQHQHHQHRHHNHNHHHHHRTFTTVTTDDSDIIDEVIMSTSSSSLDENWVGSGDNEIGSRKSARVKRSTSVERNVEMMLAVDHLMEKFHGEMLEEYLLTLTSIVSSIYSDKTVGNYINIVLVKVLVLDEDLSSKIITPNPKTTLANFCKWQRKVNQEDGQKGHWDTAVLLTRVDLCSSSQNCDILGLAELGAMCELARSCSIAEDSGLSSAFTIAHELGHVLGITHDDGDCLIRHSDHFTIMARTMDNHGKSWCWSYCSRDRLSNFLDSGKGDCLNNFPISYKSTSHLYDEDGVLTPAGNIYTADQQCAFVFGRNYVRCPYAPTCANLWCKSKNKTDECESVHMQWADGTPCSQDRDYGCLQGKCVKKVKQQRMDGQWGEWQPYGECSRTCGGGIHKSIRQCNNPEPSNGGRYCLGKRTKYKSCNHEDCPEDAEDFRESQCKQFNGNHFNISGLDHTVKWMAKISDIKPTERCKLYCQVESSDAYYRLKERVLDGTKCGPDTSDVCVFGQCEKAGCDNRMGSSKTYDRCGVCGGDDSECRIIKDEYKGDNKMFYGYNQVVHIPRGATHVDIKQYSHTGDEKDNAYLAVMDLSGHFMVNGYFSVCYYEKEVKLPSGGMLQYSGAHGEVERINTTASLKTDLFVYVLMVGDNPQPPIIKWEYTERMYPTIPSYRERLKQAEEFYWTRKDWTTCNKMCQGTTTRETVCIHKDTGGVVSEQYCIQLGAKPDVINKHCNSDCELRWEVTELSKCRADCGNWGIKRQRVDCLKVDLTTNQGETLVVSEENCGGSRPHPVVECFNRCDDQALINNIGVDAVWKYSDWSECSKSCGGGEQRRSVDCVDNDGSTLSSYRCNKDKESLVQVCNNHPCPTWSAGDWSQCSATCGDAVQTRQVACMESSSSAPPPSSSSSSSSSSYGDNNSQVKIRMSRVPDSHCSVMTIPLTKQSCFVRDCPIGRANDQNRPMSDQSNILQEYNWVVTDWGQCSRSCDGGIQMRNVACNDWMGRDSDDNQCNPTNKPINQQPCNNEPCPTWVHGDWGQCSSSCGAGHKHRIVICYPISLKADTCDVNTKPNSTQECHLAPCSPTSSKPPSSHHKNGDSTTKSTITTTTISNDIIPVSHQMRNWNQPIRKEAMITNWMTGGWSECSQTCGKGTRHRQVTCLNSRGDLLSDDSCDSNDQPHESESCQERYCGEWRTGDWTECSRSCNGGIQMRHVACNDWMGRDSDDNQCNPTSKPINQQPCNNEPCPTWVHGDWSECSATCDGGLQQRMVKCQWPTKDPPDATPEMCHDPRPLTSKECHVTTCELPKPRWIKRPWSQCSVTCGIGMKTREVLCMDKTTGAVLTNGRCRKPKPEVTTQCHKGECFKWNATDWSKCSRTCEGGTQRRQVTCVNKSTGDRVRKSCRHLPKPNETRRCNVNVRCHSVMWVAGNWSQCSSTCGHGSKLREVKCIEVSTNMPTNSDRCSKLIKPKNRTECFLRHCPYTWLTSDWTQCSRTCGEGIEKRALTCRAMSMEGRMLPNSRNTSLCNASKRPPVERPCNLGGCHEGFRWHADPWSSCSKTCGIGQMSRHIHCIGSRTRMRVDDLMCRQAIKPDTTKSCIREQCYPSSCDDLRRNGMVKVDGDYILMIRGILVYMYCYGMSGPKPKEYISLMSEDNYSEIYDKRLVRLNTCPNNGTRLADNCTDCFQPKTNQQSGITKFNKIRFNVTTLQVIVNDFTFATKKGYKGVSYGTAGDCYSKSLTCPQGSFSINLSGTMFNVSPNEKWVAYGSFSHVGVKQPYNRQIIRGKCGGYCGGCRPSKDGKLQLEIYQ